MRSDECRRDEKGECVAEKKMVTALIEYESGGGMGESDAVEEGLRGIIENPKNPTRFSLSSISTTESDETEDNKWYIIDIGSVPNMAVMAHSRLEILGDMNLRQVSEKEIRRLEKEGRIVKANI